MLQELSLAWMGFKYIEVGAFCGAREISTLILDSNKLISPPQLCSLKCCLVDLQISNNRISRLSKHFFHGFKKLKEVNLNNNDIIALPDLHWIQYSLSVIKANQNKIESLAAFDISGIYSRLHYVAVLGNYIRYFNVTLLRHIPKLYYLNLYENNLTHIGDLRTLFTGLMDLRHNPWHCDEDLSWMSEEDMRFERGLTCATPSCLHGMAIADMSKWLLTLIARFMGPTWVHLGSTGPRWAPCWLHEPCYLWILQFTFFVLLWLSYYLYKSYSPG